MLIETLAIIGVGLIGGSLARALKQTGAVRRVIAYDRDESCLQTAIKLGVIDEYACEIGAIVRDADVVVLATPLSTTKELFAAMVNHLKPNTIISDVGSVKSCVVEDARQYLGQHFQQFVPGHPIAGTEKSGVVASFAELFNEHRVILTPVPETSANAIDVVTRMWQIVGADVVQLGVSHHDEILAATSHLPHLLAYALVEHLSAVRDNDEIFEFAAGGFADFSRIAASDPSMWCDICLNNKAHLLKLLEQYEQHLRKIKNIIADNNSDALMDILIRIKKTRDKFNDKRNQRNTLTTMNK